MKEPKIVISDYLRGVRTGRLEIIQGVRDLLENSDSRISILSILELLDRKEQEILDVFKKAGL